MDRPGTMYYTTYIQRCALCIILYIQLVYYTLYYVKYSRYDFGIVKKYEFSHGGYISVIGKPINPYNFM